MKINELLELQQAVLHGWPGKIIFFLAVLWTCIELASKAEKLAWWKLPKETTSKNSALLDRKISDEKLKEALSERENASVFYDAYKIQCTRTQRRLLIEFYLADSNSSISWGTIRATMPYLQVEGGDNGEKLIVRVSQWTRLKFRVGTVMYAGCAIGALVMLAISVFFAHSPRDFAFGIADVVGLLALMFFVIIELPPLAAADKIASALTQMQRSKDS